MVGHLRPVKDPLLAAAAARLAPAGSRLRIEHIGAALDPALERAARLESEANPRWRWLGPLSRRETLRAIGSAHVLLITSRSEGGSNVVAEAVMAGTPVLSTRIEGTLGMLGPDYPGYFPVGNAAALASALARLENEPALLAELTARCAALRPRFERAREREAWRALLAELQLAR